ncbi:MAG: hypothetical protein ACOYXR_09320 [Nitrospirota bacterium]
MAYAALSTIQTIAAGEVFTAATLQQANDNGEFLIDPPACSIKETTAQSIANTTAVALTADEENYDNDSMHSGTDSKVYAQTAGRYLLIATVAYAANATGERGVIFRVDGTTSYNSLVIPTRGAGSTTYVTGVRTLVFTAGQYVECMGYQNSGGALNTNLNEFAVLFLTR